MGMSSLILSIHAIRETYAAVIATLSAISQGNDRDKAIQAQGFLYVVALLPVWLYLTFCLE